MASKLNIRDRQLLQAGNDIRIGNKPYENGIFGTNPNRDFIQVIISNANGGVLDSTTKLANDIQFDVDDKISSFILISSCNNLTKVFLTLIV